MKREIITTLEAFEEGAKYPPAPARERLADYALQDSRYEGTYNQDSTQWVRVKNTRGKWERHKVDTQNYYRLMVQKFSSLLLTELPLVTHKQGEEQTQTLLDIVAQSGLFTALRLAYIDFLSKGTAYLNLYRSEGVSKVTAIDPALVYKIVDQRNKSNVLCYVCTNKIEEYDYKKSTQDSKKERKARVVKHFKGYYIEEIYKVEKGALGACLSSSKVQTGLRGFAVWDMQNNMDSRNVYGVGDFDNIADLVRLVEYETTLTHLTRYKNINPLIQLPRGVLVANSQTGEVEQVGGGDTIQVDGDDKDAKYITHDIQLGEVVGWLKHLKQEIATQSEMGMVFLAGEINGGNISGEALKNMLLSALSKVSRDIDALDPAVRGVMSALLELEGYECTVADIVVEWRDGIQTTIETTETQKVTREAPQGDEEVQM